MTEVMSRQEDEISVLESIFNDEEILRTKEHGASAGQFCAQIELPANFRIVYKSNESGLITLPTLTYLPPIVLHYNLPDDYPLNPNSPPTFTLTCQWLTREQLSKLCKHLDKLWKDSQVDDAQGTEILYIWAQFLKDESLSFLEFSKNNTLDITLIERAYICNRVQPTPATEKTSAYTAHQSVTAKSKNLETSNKAAIISRQRSCELDCRAVTDPINNLSLTDCLIEYNDKKSTNVFRKQFHMCNICCLSRQGSHCSRFVPCNHVFCEECTRSYFTVNIADGKVLNISCPESKCNSEATFNQIKALISPELFAKYDAMLLEATLTSLGDIVICPRPGCQYTVTREGEEKLATCFQCRYTFCIDCRMVYHGIEPCRFKSGEEQRLIKEYSEGSEEERLILEKRYSKKRLETLIQTSLTNSWLTDNSKPCPHCNVAIQKSHGCNKITCWKCGTHFCWICANRLDANFPYLHFSQTTSPCYQLLFHGVEEGDSDEEGVGAEEEEEEEEEFVEFV